MPRPMLLALALTACSGRSPDMEPASAPEPSEPPSQTEPTVPQEPAEPVASPAPSAGAAVTQTGLDLMPLLFDGTDRNEVYSPASISLAFGLLAAGAAGETEAGLYHALHLDPQTADATLAELMKAAADIDARPDTSLSIANRVWLDDTLSILDTYAETSREHFGAEAARVDFRGAPDASRQTINEWVSDATQGFIPQLFSEGSITPETRLTLTNAVYFKADWASPFSAEATQDGDFTKVDGSIIQVPMMQQEGTFAYTESDTARVLMMPYQGYTLDFIVVLPAQGGDLVSVLPTLDADTIDTWSRTARSRPVNVKLPRFEMRASYTDLVPAMSALGASQAFSPQADFSNLSDAESLFADSAVHKAYIKVDETGTEAAAATGITMRTTSAMQPPPPVDFHADQPFWFGIRDRATGTLLFAGRVVEPVEEG